MNSSLLKTLNYIKRNVSSHPKIGMILGSGWFSPFKNNLQVIPYKKIPNFIQTCTPGHKGELVIARYKKKDIVILSGRVHLYEGISLKKVCLPLRLLGAMGIKNIIITASCGSLHKNLKPGDIAVIYDHINLMGDNPLIGEKNRFIDMNLCYDKEMIERFIGLSKKAGIIVKRAIYVGVKGPTYETPAERKMMQILGGDVVGMSLVPEAITSRALGINILALGGVVNMVGEMSKESIRHEKVVARAKDISSKIAPVIRKFVEEM